MNTDVVVRRMETSGLGVKLFEARHEPSDRFQFGFTEKAATLALHACLNYFSVESDICSEIPEVDCQPAHHSLGNTEFVWSYFELLGASSAIMVPMSVCEHTPSGLVAIGMAGSGLYSDNTLFCLNMLAEMVGLDI